MVDEPSMTALRVYFAYGSNMCSRRLSARVGPVRALGAARLDDHEHRFSKLGRDGTGKGNVERRLGRVVHGVAYEVTEVQLVRLADFEGGYRRVELDIVIAEQARAAATFVALHSVDAPPPSPEYVAHYRRGILEHGLPRAYARTIFDALDGWCDTGPMSGGRP